MSDNSAILAGYTDEYLATSGVGPDIHIFVRPDSDLDSTCRVYDADSCEFIRLNCWNFTFERITL